LKNKKEILIVGGTGFIGYHLARKCLKMGWIVTCMSTKKPKSKRFLKRVKYLICDITKKKIINRNIKNQFDFVVNAGGYVDHSDKKKTYESHFNGTKNLANFFLNKKIKSFIQIGSSGEYGDLKSPHYEKNFPRKKPISTYYKSKFLSTIYLLSLFKKKNFPVTIIRLYQAFGPNQDLNRFIPIIINGCLKDEKFPCSDGKQFRDFIFIDDVVDAIVKSLNNKKSLGEIINIGSGKPLKIRNIIELIKNKVKRGKPNYGEILLRGDEKIKTYPSIKKAKKIINWSPKITFNLGLNKTINYYKKNLYNYKIDD